MRTERATDFLITEGGNNGGKSAEFRGNATDRFWSLRRSSLLLSFDRFRETYNWLLFQRSSIGSGEVKSSNIILVDIFEALTSGRKEAKQPRQRTGKMLSYFFPLLKVCYYKDPIFLLSKTFFALFSLFKKAARSCSKSFWNASHSESLDFLNNNICTWCGKRKKKGVKRRFHGRHLRWGKSRAACFCGLERGRKFALG